MEKKNEDFDIIHEEEDEGGVRGTVVPSDSIADMANDIPDSMED